MTGEGGVHVHLHATKGWHKPSYHSAAGQRLREWFALHRAGKGQSAYPHPAHWAYASPTSSLMDG